VTVSGKLALGTAQFGLQYGIADPDYQVPESEARALLELASAGGIRMLDTAPAYGESEAVLGRCLAGKPSFDIVTKTVPGTDAQAVAKAFSASLKRLRCEAVYGVLVHHAGDLLSAGGKRLYELLAGWRAEGRTLKLGVSVYTRAEIEAVLERYRVDIVQLPVSVFDQRLAADGTLARLKRGGVEIHARSAFLQGLALMDPAQVPRALKAARPLVAGFHAALARRGLSPVAGALGYLSALPEIDRIVVGVHSARQLAECIAALRHPATELDFSGFACTDEEILDPRRWTRRPTG
jgi:aryl-alcohol dehydrogenase-like predicted oxidoreductase